MAATWRLWELAVLAIGGLWSPAALRYPIECFGLAAKAEIPAHM
jgi:hypothetical protein